MLETKAPTPGALREELRLFFSAYLEQRVLDSETGSLRTLVLLCKANRNKKPKEKLITWMLLRVSERLLEERGGPPSERDRIICEFLIGELRAYVAGGPPSA